MVGLPAEVSTVFRRVLVLALLAAPGPVLARPAQAPPKVDKVVAAPVPAPVCTRVRRKSFHPAEGWSVKTVSLACKTVTAAVSQPGGKSFTSLKKNRDRTSK